MGPKLVGMVGVVAGLLAAPALAHHSFAMFDANVMREAQGTIKEFQWTNPHSWIEIIVPDAQGKPVVWALELGGPGALSREGWTPTTIVPGDKVTVKFHPRRDGTPGGQFKWMRLASGKIFEE